MNLYVAVTDSDWFRFLRSQPLIDEVNFWQPGGSSAFRRLQPGEPLLFKLHAPQNFIVGGGFFAHFSRLPASRAWEAFEEKNGDLRRATGAQAFALDAGAEHLADEPAGGAGGGAAASRADTVFPG